jgi:hypothetical protein
MAIYDKPTKRLMADWARDHLESGQVFSKQAPVGWFRENYPNIKSNTVGMHVEGMAVNNRNRRHHANIKPGSGHDLFFKLGPNRFRLWNAETDPPPRYKPDIEREEGNTSAGFDAHAEIDEVEDRLSGDESFAYERDLQNYLVRNLQSLEPGLVLFEDEGLNGVEYDAGGRFIDILAVDKNGQFVVIELKVSKGYDRVIGQLLRYIAWVEKNLSDGVQVRGFIVANEISDDLRLATRKIPGVKLFQYKLAFSLEDVPAA